MLQMKKISYSSITLRVEMVLSFILVITLTGEGDGDDEQVKVALMQCTN